MPVNSNVTSDSFTAHNSLSLNDQKIFYKKILSNIMIRNESRVLDLINKLIMSNLQPITREQELECLRPWPCTLVESAEAVGMTRVVNMLKSL